ncbi:hypothetical protein D9M69_504940 [compost metagenome]
MGTGAQHHELVGLEGRDVQAVGGCVLGEHAHVGEAVDQRTHDVAAQLFLDLDANIGMLSEEGRQRGRKELRQRRHVGPQPHMAAHAAGVVAQLVAELLEALEEAHRMLHRHVPGGRERDPLGAAFEQLRTRGGLEIGQAPTRRREREVTRFRALGDAARLGHGAEQAQRHEIDTRGVDGAGHRRILESAPVPKVMRTG